jgi:hypothetical protein
VKESKKEEVKPMKVDSEKTIADSVPIGNVNMVIKDVGKGPMIFRKSDSPSVQKPSLANDHEASSSNSADKYSQPRWCPPGLTHT